MKKTEIKQKHYEMPSVKIITIVPRHIMASSDLYKTTGTWEEGE